ncbi:VOC family protein [Galactobacter valiniphilus]|uniref:VOC family protein n=1 Tax=Galactobacter valiniphilus TaxID=2676122 RepID=UPI003734C33A
MARMIFVNLPVTNLGVADAFYDGLGFTKIGPFSNDVASAWRIDENIWVMLLLPGFYSTFLREGDQPSTPSGTQQKLNALSADSREEVDAFVAAAATHGGRVYRPAVEEMPGMYGAAVKDPDGHVWEIMWMDPALTGGA